MQILQYFANDFMVEYNLQRMETHFHNLRIIRYKIKVTASEERLQANLARAARFVKREA